MVIIEPKRSEKFLEAYVQKQLFVCYSTTSILTLVVVLMLINNA